MSDSDSKDAAVIDALAADFENRLEILSHLPCSSTRRITSLPTPILLCDAGYGVPREPRPRKEKILAMSRQLVNFLQWQEQQVPTKKEFATIQVVACQDESIKQALEERTLALLHEQIGDGNSASSSSSSPPPTALPQHVSFSCQSLEEACEELAEEVDEPVIYLSPDVSEALDATKRPPRYVVVGLLIDRRIQPHRSHNRAINLNLIAKRWPLDNCFQDISANEPLNVDCILEGMQQWWWNSDDISNSTGDSPSEHREAFMQAAAQAIQHHADRHPSRPVHKRT